MPSTVKRQSAAVMFTDIAGYTSIMASDEEKALSLLQEKRQVLKPLIDKHDGWTSHKKVYNELSNC